MKGKKTPRRPNRRPPKYTEPDVTISVRMNPQGQQGKEGEALAILKEYEAMLDASGEQLATRYIITMALLSLKGVKLPQADRSVSGLRALADAYGTTLDEFRELVATLRGAGIEIVNAPAPTATAKQGNVPLDYLKTLAKGIKNHKDGTR